MPVAMRSVDVGTAGNGLRFGNPHVFAIARVINLRGGASGLLVIAAIAVIRAAVAGMLVVVLATSAGGRAKVDARRAVGRKAKIKRRRARSE